MDMTWVILSFGATLCLALVAEINRRFKVEGFRLNLLKSVFAVLFGLPLLLVAVFPQDLQFYLIATTQGLMSVYAMNVFFDLAKRYETRVSAMYLGVTAVAAFILWYMLKPTEMSALLSNEILAVALIICFIGVIVSLQFLRENDLSLKVLKTLLPLGLLFAFVDVSIKIFIEGNYPIWQTVLTFVMVSFAVNAVFSYFYMVYDKREISVDRPIIIQAALIGILSFATLFAATSAIVMAPNPAYPGIIMMNVPVLLFAYHKLTGTKDDASPAIAGAMIALTGGLVYLTL